MIHTVIVPGVGGSSDAHWQSWLQRQLMSCSRVQQQEWNHPVLDHWVETFVRHLYEINTPIQIVAHSFGCLTSIAALNRFPELALKVQKMILVAPANPARFSSQGFAQNSAESYLQYFNQLKLNTKVDLIISENDPWLCFQDAQTLAKAWNVNARNLGQVGHINVESGFGPFPEIFDHIEMNLNEMKHQVSAHSVLNTCMKKDVHSMPKFAM